jgi:hypothetical protein
VAEGYVDRKRSAAISFAAAGELPSVYVEKIVGDVLSDVRAALEIAYHPQNPSDEHPADLIDRMFVAPSPKSRTGGRR